jgi:beta-alanine--pyruvate transaminase
MGGVELSPADGKPGKRAYDIFLSCYERGVLVRSAGDTIALTPPFIATENDITHIVDTLGAALKASTQ